MTAGTITTAEYISPSRYTLASLDARMLRTGIGSDKSRSLSFDIYRPDYVLNTLPNAPSAIAIRLIIKKYSQLICNMAKGPQSVTDK